MALQWRGAEEIEDALTTGLKMAGDALLSNTIPRVPLDQGDLRASGSVTVDGDAVSVGFGTEYGVIQHQRTRYSHDVGEAKFLEAASEEFGPEFEQILAEQVRRATGS